MKTYNTVQSYKRLEKLKKEICRQRENPYDEIILDDRVKEEIYREIDISNTQQSARKDENEEQDIKFTSAEDFEFLSSKPD
jgi:guanylate kinase